MTARPMSGAQVTREIRTRRLTSFKDLRQVTIKPKVLLKYRSGVRSSEPLLVAAAAIARGEAVLIDERGGVITPTRVVICRRDAILQDMGPRNDRGFALKLFRAGTEVDVIDPGSEHCAVIASWSPAGAATVWKGFCREVGEGVFCADADTECGRCCNNKPSLKKQWKEMNHAI